MNAVNALIRKPPSAITAIGRTWGRYQHRLARGHVALGRPGNALQHAQRAARCLQRAGKDNMRLAAVLDTLATCHQDLGQLDAAAQTRRRAVGLLDAEAIGSRGWVAALVRFGDLCRFQGRYDDAADVLSRAVDGAAAGQLADGVPLRAMALNALGILYKDTGRYDAAADAYAEALELITAINPPEHTNTAAVWHNLAGLAHARGHPEQAAPLAAHAVELREQHLGPDHHLVAQDLAVLGAALLDQDRVAEAEPLFERALTIFRRRHPADQYEVAVNISNVAACRLACGDPTSAERLFRQGLAIKQAILGPDHPEIARQLNNLAVARAQLHRADEANELHRRALSIAELTLGASHPLVATCRANASHE